jgi:transcriptional regulator
MHPNPIFRSAERTQNLDFARERGFGTVAVNGSEGPLLAHVPFIISEDGLTAEMHLVRSNPIARAFGDGLPAVLSVEGPDSYISPDWYEIDDQVPTWNYVSVSLRGSLTLLDATVLRKHLDSLSAEHETRLAPKPPWTSDKMTPQVLEKMMRFIVPVRLSIEAVDGTWKLGQNKEDAARTSAAKFVKSHKLGHETTLLSALMLGAGKTE